MTMACAVPAAQEATPLQLRRLILRAWAQEPSRRPSAHELAQSLEALTQAPSSAA